LGAWVPAHAAEPCRREVRHVPRYAFHLGQKDHCIYDQYGVQLDSLRRAHSLALKMIEKVMTMDDITVWRGWMIRIDSDGNEPELTILFPTAPLRRLESAPITGRMHSKPNAGSGPRVCDSLGPAAPSSLVPVHAQDPRSDAISPRLR
jgi:hypothetical protein